jgi:hypothetical protein
MSSQGAMPLSAYANGGVATGPQMALFGEGRHNEAFVPLPDGRTIPVTMRMPDYSGLQAGKQSSNVSITNRIELSGARGNMEIQEAAMRAVQASAPQVVSAAVSAVRKGFSGIVNDVNMRET